MMFVTRKIAKKLKEKGFKEKCFGYYLPNGDAGLIYNYNQFRSGIYEDCLYSHNSLSEDVLGHDLIDAPTIEQVLEWLRNEREILVKPGISYDTSEDADGNVVERWTFWLFEIFSTSDGNLIYTEEMEEYDTYEQATLAGIEYVLDNLI